MPTLHELIGLRRKPRHHVGRNERKGKAAGQPRAVELHFIASLVRINRKMRAAVMKALESVIAQVARKDGERMDIAVRSTMNTFAFLTDEIHGIYDGDDVDEAVGSTASKIDRYNFTEMKRVLGVDAISAEGIQSQLYGFRREASGLIRSLSGDVLTRVRGVLDESMDGALRVEEIQKRLTQQFDIVDSRAALIARDQVLKVNSSLTKQRQENAGVLEYIWTTSNDERVRPMHRKLDGTRHSWRFPPVVSEDGRREPPGQDFQCRCTATPIIPDLDT